METILVASVARHIKTMAGDLAIWKPVLVLFRKNYHIYVDAHLKATNPYGLTLHCSHPMPAAVEAHPRLA